MNPIFNESHELFKLKRDQISLEIRKKKTDEFIKRKRIKFFNDIVNLPNEIGNKKLDMKEVRSLKDLVESFYNVLKEDNLEILGEVLETLRRSISNSETPPVKEFIETGVMTDVLSFLNPLYFQDSFRKILQECTWIVANVASGDSDAILLLIHSDICKILYEIMTIEDDSILENALWTFSNIVGESNEYRNYILNKDLIPKINQLLDKDNLSPQVAGALSWLISNLVRKPMPSYVKLKSLLEYIPALIKHEDNSMILINCLWTLAYLSDGTNDQINDILNLNLTDNILKYAVSDEVSVRIPCARIIGNILSGEDLHAQILLNKNILDIIKSNLDHEEKRLRKEGAWALSNILAGNHIQIQKVFSYLDGHLINQLFEMICKEEYDILRECIFALTNPCLHGTLEQINTLIRTGLIDMLLEMMGTLQEKHLLISGIEAIGHILDKAKREFKDQDEMNPYILKIYNCNGLQILENLQKHDDHDVYSAVVKLIDKHFDCKKSN